MGAGRSSWVPRMRAQQRCAAGHRSQRGLRGVQTVAPSSISAWFSSPGEAPGAICAAMRQSRDCVGLGSSTQRANTRRTLPSTMGASCPKAMEVTAPAV